jgi:HAD superfamily hydrolase (TIGR01509 family)
LDGTLADSLGVMKAAFFVFHLDRGLICTQADFDALNGPPLREVVESIRIRHGLRDSVDALLVAYQAGVEAAYQAVRAADGAEELLQVATGRGWTCAVVTSSSEALARRWLRRSALECYVTTVIGTESITEGKPSPAPYREALARTNVNPARSFAIEDSVAGLTSARAAGLFTFFLGEAGAARGSAAPGITVGFVAIRSLRDVLPRIAT